MNIIPLYIPDLFGEVVTAVSNVFSTRSADRFSVYYDFGHQAEVIRNLTNKDNSITMKDQKFPLIWLVTDFAETMAPQDNNQYAQVSLKVFITVTTQPEYDMKSRRDKTFLPRLYPIYAELLHQFSECVAFSMPPTIKIQHTKIDRPYWGTPDAAGNNTKNMVNNFCDAIEIQNLKLNVARQIC